jgi:pimeloyl-ACP methyl ester carboxylesterase
MKLFRFLSRWLKRALVFLLALLFFSTIYSAYADHRDASRFPPPGKLIALGDHQIHIDCAGQGSPTLVLESALGGPSPLWQPIKDKLVPSARVCSYDREGIGWSTDSGRLRSAQGFASDLHQALAMAGERGPFVLVGHSVGGMLVLNYARLYPQDVAGVVLLDPTHPEQFAEGSEQWHDHQQALPIFRSGPVLSRLGLLRFGLWMTDRLKPLPLPQQTREEYIGLASTPKAANAMKSEAVALFQLCRQSAELPDLGDKPVLVLSAARTLAEGFPVRYHEQMAHLSTRGVHRVVPDASHSGIVLKPGSAQVSADGIREVVDAVRKR